VLSRFFQQSEEFLFGQSCLLYYGQKCAFLESFVSWNGDLVCSVGEEDVAALLVDDLESCSVQSFEGFSP
jgi:hypothetical protein